MSTKIMVVQYLLIFIFFIGLTYANNDVEAQKESPITTFINTNIDKNDGPVITHWMITTFIIAGSVISFWALCICALAICLLRLYWKAKRESNSAERINSTENFDKSKSKKTKSNRSKHLNLNLNLNDNSSDSDDTQFGSGLPSDTDDNELDHTFHIKDTHNINLEESINGEPSSSSKPNINKIVSMRKPKKRYSMRAITIDHTALHNKYHSAPVPKLSMDDAEPPGIGNNGNSLSNNSHPIESRHYYHGAQPPSVDIHTLKQLIYNNPYQQSNDSRQINGDNIINIKMSVMNTDEDDEDDEDDNDSNASDDDIYIKPESGDIHLTPTLGAKNDINECKDKDGDGFPDTHDRGASSSQYTYTYSQTDHHKNGRDGRDGNQMVISTKMNIQNPPPTVISDHSVYPSIPSINHIPPNINVNIPIGPLSLNSSNSKSPMSAIYDKGVTPDGLNMFNNTTTNNNNMASSSGPSIFQSLTNQQKTATPTYKLPKYNVTKGQWM